MSDPSVLAVKSALSIYGRLFDHRPLIQGEARFFIEEFQNKRKDSDSVKLEQCKVGLDNLCNEVLPACATGLQENLTTFDTKVVELMQLCDTILPDRIEPDTTSVTYTPNTLSPGQDSQWDLFIKEIEEERQQIEELFEHEVEQYKVYLKRQYQ